jgi:hypothetical protein
MRGGGEDDEDATDGSEMETEFEHGILFTMGGFAGLHWNFDPDDFLYRFI